MTFFRTVCRNVLPVGLGDWCIQHVHWLALIGQDSPCHTLTWIDTIAGLDCQVIGKESRRPPTACLTQSMLPVFGCRSSWWLPLPPDLMATPTATVVGAFEVLHELIPLRLGVQTCSSSNSLNSILSSFQQNEITQIIGTHAHRANFVAEYSVGH